MKLIEYIINNLSFISTLVIAVVSIIAAVWITVLSVRFIYRGKQDKLVLKSNNLLKSINVGMLCFSLEEPYKILSANDIFYRLLGYDEIDAKNENKVCLMDFIHPEDNSILHNPQGLRNMNTINCDVRMVSRDGKSVYLLFDGTEVQGDDGSAIIQAIVVDITRQQKLQERMIIESERYRIATELSNDVIFEYDIQSGDLIFTDKYEELFGRSAKMYNFMNHYHKHYGIIYPDDWGSYLNFCQMLIVGSDAVECKIRIKDIYGEYIWCQMIGKTIYDDNHQPMRVIGKMVNVDVQKRELENLTYKATRDPLTGIYNKEATVKKIENYINGNKIGQHILMFIDFDDFKKVNDSFGHLVGDKVLSFMVMRIQSVFSDGEIIGRIGGDEFVVFIGNIENMQETIVKANKLIKALDTEYIDNKRAIPITGSIGIASYPEDGLHFDSLLERADEALYRVKDRGKNDFLIYDGTKKVEEEV